ncbi:ghrelin O-acyltransferase [Hypomesus transpacificus]|uniref:ghrelin O-acyltransferase n=1 Tax=Hypomesus transpacificus TaxID=137520 RepID=UPI001F07C868|nr:ghrelin O-acyltransferase [Hypomesus transpacificus]
MEPIHWLFEQHPFLMYQVFSVPFAFLFYGLSREGYLSLANRHVFLALGGCALAVVSMGVYSLLLFASTGVFLLLVCSLSPAHVHPWVFGVQMSWQTLWHLYMQYREYYLNETTHVRFLLSVSSLMLITQRMSSVSVDVQEGRVRMSSRPAPLGRPWALLPLLSYMFNFTTLLGGPLQSYHQFVCCVEQIDRSPPPHPLRVVFLKGVQVFSLECLRSFLTRVLRAGAGELPRCSVLGGVVWAWGLALALRTRYYSHWKVSECLNNAAGFGFRGIGTENVLTSWSGLSDGNVLTTEMSCRVSVFARQWNATTAAWLRRQVFDRCRTSPIMMTFGFSILWHGLHPGQFVGFLIWASAVKADHQIHPHLKTRLTSTWRKLGYAGLGWMHTQIVITCVVIAVELRSFSSLRLLYVTYIGVFPFLFILLYIGGNAVDSLIVFYGQLLD